MQVISTMALHDYKVPVTIKKKTLHSVLVNHGKLYKRGRMGKGVVFTTTLIEWSGFNPHPGYAVASLGKTLYDDYLCLVASNKQQIQWTRIRRNPQEHWITGNS